jgi:MTH538 TIR-like domain (DUF1863)
MDASSTLIAAVGPGADYRYWAFISYSHRDEQWAHWLHASLETYRIPKALKNRVAAMGSHGVPDRLFPVFRDRDELGGGFDLDERIRLALQQSRFLIVICSPASAASPHVQREIEAFEALGGEDRVLCLIAGGEPGAIERAETRALECFSPPLRTRHKDGALVVCEPLAPDVRKAKDGKTNAKLKLIATMLDVSFDDLKRRDEHRRLRRRVQLSLTLAAAGVLLATGYLTALDAGLDGPGGNAFRGWLDSRELAVMRPIPEDSAIRDKADALRTTLVARLEQARASSNTYATTFDRSRFEPWAHNMAVVAILSQSPTQSTSAGGREHLRAPSSPGFGRVGSNAIPEFWGYMALARQVALGLDDADTRMQLAATARGLDRFRSTAEPGGWSIFLSEPEMPPDAYTTTMALMALLEARRASLPWSGSADERDALIRTSFDWLVQHFNAGANPPGWQAGGTSLGESADGLTLQVYGRLLDAEREAGLRIAEAIARAIPRHLARVDDRSVEFPVASGEFSNGQVNEAINFLWYPWAVDCAVRWLYRSAGSPESTQERVDIQRLLGHLVLELGDEAVANATKQWTFSASETLYGLSSIHPEPRETH